MTGGAFDFGGFSTGYDVFGSVQTGLRTLAVEGEDRTLEVEGEDRELSVEGES